jgi:hypothetical protein
MIRHSLVLLLIFFGLPAFAEGYPDLGKAPADAKGYCARLTSLASVQSYASQYVNAGIQLSNLAPAGSIYQKSKTQLLRFHSLGLDDNGRSLSKKVLERVNKAVPKQDAYNQDIAFRPYAAWFAACASSLGSKDPRIVVFLDPMKGEVESFFNTPAAEREQKLVELMGNPGMGGLEQRSIVDRTGLEFTGINPRWVLPMAVAMTGADSWLAEQERVVTPVIEQFAAALNNMAAVARSVEDGTHPGCQRIEKSQAVKDYVAAVLEVQRQNIRSDQVSRLVARTFSDPEGKLISTIKARLRELGTVNGKFDDFKHDEVVNQFNSIIENCARKNLDTDLFLFFASSADDSGSVARQREDFSKAKAVLLSYDGKRPRGGNSLELTPKWASLYAFIFNDTDTLIGQEAEDNPRAILSSIDTILEERREQIARNEQEKYAGLRALYALSNHSVLRAAYEKCRKGEKTFQSNITSQIEAEARKADIVAEQKQLLENVKYRTKNIDALTHGMCLYRMNVALNVIEFNNEIAALSTGYQASWLGTTDLSAKFTANALGKVANQLEQPAEKFHQRIDDIVRKSTKELNQQRAVTRRQQEQLFASRLSISMFGNIIYSGIFEMLVEPVAEGKHL